MTRPPVHVATSATLTDHLKTQSKILYQLLGFGIGALALGAFGELSLTRSSPIFAYLGWTYNTWQMNYVVGLTLLTIVWLAAVAQRLGIIAECRKQRARTLRVEADRDAREQRRRAPKPPPVEESLPRRPPKTRSNKFDY